MKLVNQIISYLVGGLFIFSGLIKLNDPRGLEIKLEEYFEVFSLDKTELGLSALSGLWLFFEPYSLWLGTTLSVLEVVLGIHLIIRYRYRLSLWLLFAMIVFFTFLTFYSALFNKVTDCGCFGDAIKLTPWQSFGKDVLLFVLLGFLLFQKESDSPTRTWQWATSLGSAFVSIFIAYWAVQHLPFMDFRAYRIGSNIPKNMQPTAKLIYEGTYKFRNVKTNEIEESKDWLPKYMDKTKYEYVKDSYKPVLKNPEAKAKITDYKVTTPQDQQDVTAKTFEGKKLIIVVADLKRTDAQALKKINDLARALEAKKIEPMILTSAGAEDFDKFRHENQLSVPYYNADKVVLKTMIRSNPGIMYWENGVVKNMWHYNDLPTEKAF